MAGICKKVVHVRDLERNELAGLALYLTHSLNFVVHSASSCQEAINMLGLIQKVYSSSVGCTTRWYIMKKIVKTNLNVAVRRDGRRSMLMGLAKLLEKLAWSLFCKTTEFQNANNILMRCVMTNYKHSNLFNTLLKK
nr:unnamed protein product [Callosobruchus analis]